MPEEKKFEFYIPLTPVKKSLKPLEDGTIDFEVKGVLNSDRKDLVGEFIPSKLINTENLVKYGRLKFEHDHPLQPTPANNVGFVTKSIKNEKDVEFEGRVFATPDDSENYKLAKQIMHDFNNIEAWNKKYPNSQKSMGISLQGPMITKDNKLSEIIVMDIVFTTGPVNQGSFAKAVQKSLSATYNVDPNTMTGADVLKQESLNNKKKRTKMRFKDEKSAIDYYKGLGNSDAEAKEKAENYFESRETIKKSLSAGTRIISEALSAISEENEGLEDAEKKVTKLQKSLNAAIDPEDKNEVDAEEFFRIQAKNAVGNNSSIIRIEKSLLKIGTALLSSQQKGLEAIDNLHKQMDEDAEIIDSLSTQVEFLQKSLKKVTGGLSTDPTQETPGGKDRENENGTGESGADKEVTRVEKLSKSLKSREIEDVLVSTMVNQKDFEALVPSTVTPEFYQNEVGMARAYGYVYKSLSENLRKVVDIKLKDRIADILDSKE